MGLEASFGSYEALLASDLVDRSMSPCRSRCTPSGTLRALEAGKHVLCEKPFATDPADAARCFDAAEAAGRVVVEGFMRPGCSAAIPPGSGPSGSRTLRPDPTAGWIYAWPPPWAGPGEVLALFDVGLDLTRRDQLELVGTGGRLVVPDPWVCRAGAVELESGGHTERLPADRRASGVDR